MQLKLMLACGLVLGMAGVASARGKEWQAEMAAARFEMERDLAPQLQEFYGKYFRQCEGYGETYFSKVAVWSSEDSRREIMSRLLGVDPVAQKPRMELKRYTNLAMVFQPKRRMSEAIAESVLWHGDVQLKAADVVLMTFRVRKILGREAEVRYPEIFPGSRTAPSCEEVRTRYTVR